MTNFQTLFEQCGKFYLPGARPIGEPLARITPPTFDPGGGGGGGGIKPPLRPIDPIPGDPLFKCTEVFVPCPAPNGNITERILRRCEPCLDSAGNPLISPITSPVGAEECQYRSSTCDDPGTPPCLDTVFICPGELPKYKCERIEELCPPNTVPRVRQVKRRCVPCPPGSTDPDCVYTTPDCSEAIAGFPPCEDLPPNVCISKPIDPGGTGGPTTGAGFKCVTTKEVCPQGTDRAGQFIRVLDKSCKTCNRGQPPAAPISNPGKVVNGKATVAGTIITEGPCQFTTQQLCVAACPPVNVPPLSLGLDAICNEVPQAASLEPPGGGGGGGEPGGVLTGLGLSQGGSQGGSTGNPGGLGTTNTSIPGGDPAAYLQSLYIALSFTTNPNEIAIIQAEIARVEALTGLSQNGNGSISQNNTNNLPSPAASVTLPAQQLLEIQERNATVINPNEKLRQEDFSELKNLETVQKLYHPELNFFDIEPSEKIELVPNTSYRNIFNERVDVSIRDAMVLAGSNESWSEKILFNVTNEKIQASLDLDLLTAFKILRYPGGEVVGLSSFLDMIKKHLLTGTLSKIDPDFYTSVARTQLQQGFTILEGAETNEYASRYSIDYIVQNGESLLANKDSESKNVQLNRGRVLNEDLNITFPVETLLSSTKTVTMPNEGVPLDTLITTSPTTPESVGSPSLLNIGDGGGYYVDLTTLDQKIPLPTDNLLETSYYLPDFKKSKVMSLNGKSFVSIITASSLTDQHEFVSGDAGASSFEPLYFGINLNSVSSSYKNDPLIENYTATYSRITDPDQIAVHVNNNAQSLSEFRIGYDDPLYRYILDTSAFELEQEDFTVYGFKDGYSSVNFNFPKNIPFGVIILPVAGSKFNPLNAQSNLKSYSSDKLVRSLDFKPSINRFIDGTELGSLRTYNLYNEDGSTRIGLVETPSVQSFGYRYEPSAYYNTFFDGTTYTSSIEAVSSFGISYLLTEVLDYIAEQTESKTITWFDAYRRMPFNRFAELLYTAPDGIYEDIKNGFRKNLKLDFLLRGIGNQESLILPDDSRTIIGVADRDNISKKFGPRPASDF